jgi:20S proteasome alpha/beta subunit
LKSYVPSEQGSLDELIKHTLFALRESVGDKADGLNEKNVSVAIVGENQRFRIIENEELKPHLVALEGESERSEPVAMEQ